MTDPLHRATAAARQQWLILLSRHRRWAVAMFAGLAVATGLQVLAPHPPATRAVWVAAEPLAGGRPLTQHDVALVDMPQQLVPEGALPAVRPPVGRYLAGPVNRGEPLTTRRLLGADLLAAAAPGEVAVAVHVADGSELTGLVRPGDRVDVYAAQPSASGADLGTGRRIAAQLPVLAVPGAQSNGSGTVIVAAGATAATELSAAAAGAALSVAVLPR